MATVTTHGIRSARARKAVLVMHSQGKTTTTAARAKFESRWEREVDPDGQLDLAERARRARFARKAYFVQLAIRSAESRANRRAAAAKRVHAHLREAISETAASSPTPETAIPEVNGVATTTPPRPSG